MKTCFTLLTAFLTAVLSFILCPAVQSNEEIDYQPLADLLAKPSEGSGFVALTDYEDRFEEAAHTESVAYLNRQSELIQRIRDDLESPEIQWRLESLSHRLVYAPEMRQEVAGLFASYCRDAIGDVLARTGLGNPFSDISALEGETPSLENGPGVRAIIVHDLAREYIARYQFRGHSRKRIAIDLSGRIPVNEVGSYVSSLQYSEQNRSWEFTRDMHTIWKCASANPYTVLMTPIEETLHIALRAHTETAILHVLEQKGTFATPAEIQETVDGWLAVEEAIVGGLVYKLAPDVVLARIPGIPAAYIESDLETKTQFPKYRLLPRGIELVEQNGLQQSIRLFAQDPMAFRELLEGPG